jgi:hypothetical protein
LPRAVSKTWVVNLPAMIYPSAKPLIDPRQKAAQDQASAIA